MLEEETIKKAIKNCCFVVPPKKKISDVPVGSRSGKQVKRTPNSRTRFFIIGPAFLFFVFQIILNQALESAVYVYTAAVYTSYYTYVYHTHVYIKYEVQQYM